MELAAKARPVEVLEASSRGEEGRRAPGNDPSSSSPPAEAVEEPLASQQCLARRHLTWWTATRARSDLKSLKRLGGREPSLNADELRRLARFLRGRDSRLPGVVYTAYFVGLIGFVTGNALSRADRQLASAVTRAQFARSDASVAAADDMGTQMLLLALVLVAAGMLMLVVWGLLMWAWTAYSARFGGRDRNMGLATRGLLRAVNGSQRVEVASRRQLFKVTGRWAATAKRAGVQPDVVAEIVESVCSPSSRTTAGVERIQDLLWSFSQRYDYGQLLDGATVLAQRPLVWPRVGATIGGVLIAVVTPTASTVLAAWLQVRMGASVP